MAEFVIQTTDIHKSYRRGTTVTPVLKGINLTVPAGECTFLVGPSGCGKSTLLSIIGCILTPDSGTISLFGQDVQGLNNRARTQLRRDRIGFVFQRFQLIRGLTAFDNIYIPLLLRGLSRRQAHARVTELLDAVGLPDKGRSLPANLSAGQCQRVSFARALAGDPEIILADEPTASLDEQSGQEAMTLLKKLIREHHKTAIVVTHDQSIFHYADRICTIHNGHLSKTNPSPGAFLTTATVDQP